MKKFLFPFCLLMVIILGVMTVKGGDTNKNKPVAPVKDKNAEKRKIDSLAYVNFSIDSKDHTFQNTPNEVLLSNGMKIKFLKLNRFPIPRGVNVQIPDEISQRFAYELAEVEIVATNTTNQIIQLGQSASEALFVSFKMFGEETGAKTYVSQYPLSYGAIYSMMEPKQTEKVSPAYLQTTALVNNAYQPNETKTCKGYIICLAKAAKKIDKIIVQTQEFGTNKTYACPANL